jgi:vitamin B12 transporter
MRSFYRNPRRRLVGIVIMTLGWAAAAAAQEHAPAPADTVPPASIAEVTVTVARAADPRLSLPRQIDVIDRSTVELSPSAELADLLKKEVNLDVVQFPGLLAGVGIRGFRPQFSGINQRTLVLLDGRPVGAANLALVALTDIEHVEVLRGPASSLYGSSAMGGVVNVVTRRSGGPVRARARLGYGAWDARDASAHAGGNLTEALDFDIALATFGQGRDYRVGGGNLFRSWVGDDTVVRTFPDGSTEESAELGDGEVRSFSRFASRNGSLRLGYRLHPDWRVDARAERFEADRVQNPGDMFASWGDSRSLKDVQRSSADVSVRGSLDRHDLTFLLFGAREHGSNYNQPESGESQQQYVSFENRNQWHGLQLQNALAFGAHSIVVGVDYTVTEAISERFAPDREPIAPWEPDSRIDARSAFAEARIRSPDHRFTATLGGRLDRIGFEVMPTELSDGNPEVHAIAEGNRESFTVFNPSAGAQYFLPAGIRVHASGGRAFLAPGAFNVAAYVERRSPRGTVALTRGNPELRPEHSFTWDAGVGLIRPGSGLEVDATVFRTRISDRITTRVSTPPDGTTTPSGAEVSSVTTYVNADEASMRGLEWRLAFDLLRFVDGEHRVRLFGGATHLFRAEELLGEVDRPVRNVAKRSINAGVGVDAARRLSGRITGRYVGERVDDDWNSWPAAVVRYPAFLTVDASTELTLAERYRVGLLVSNLTDENYYEVRGYPLPGRAAQIRVTVDF